MASLHLLSINSHFKLTDYKFYKLMPNIRKQAVTIYLYSYIYIGRLGFFCSAMRVEVDSKAEADKPRADKPDRNQYSVTWAYIYIYIYNTVLY